MTGTGPTAPIFVVGHPRSGTTLLATMLGRHPRLAATPETHFFNEVRYALAPCYALGPARVAARLGSTRMRHLGLPEAEVAALLARADMTDGGVLSALLARCSADQGKPRVVEKTPVHIRHIPDILAAFPDARVVWILRDGRACLASLKRVDWASDDTAVLARQWTRNMSFAMAAERRFPGRIIRLRYEDLLSDGAGTMTALLGWLGEAFVSQVLDPTQRQSTISAPEESWKGNVRKPVIAGRASAWRGELSAAEINRATRIMGPVLGSLGYPVDGPLPLSEHLRQRLLNGPAGLAAQSWVQNRRARRRFAPWGANQGTSG